MINGEAMRKRNTTIKGKTHAAIHPENVNKKVKCF
jgi:hypothetical protein